MALINSSGIQVAPVDSCQLSIGEAPTALVILMAMTKGEWQARMRMLLDKYEAFRQVELFEELVTESETIEDFGAFQRWFELFGNGGCFRGHRDALWSLATTMDRAVMKAIKVNEPPVHLSVKERINFAENERAALLDFQRGAHHYIAGLPNENQVIDWLALMQHHGAPTRLLDWTLSPYVALYFAMQAESSADAALGH